MENLDNKMKTFEKVKKAITNELTADKEFVKWLKDRYDITDADIKDGSFIEKVTNHKNFSLNNKKTCENSCSTMDIFDDIPDDMKFFEITVTKQGTSVNTTSIECVTKEHEKVNKTACDAIIMNAAINGMNAILETFKEKKHRLMIMSELMKLLEK